MALYENGKRISGIRDFPAYTWDEYHALPVAKRPKVWKCTDRDYTEIPRESVSITADGVKTYSQLLDALYALIDRSKLTTNTTIEVAVSNVQYIMNMSVVTSSAICFGSINSTYAGSSSSILYALKPSGSVAQYCSYSNSGNSFTNQSASVLTSGAVITVHY